MKRILIILTFTITHLTIFAQNFGQKVYASDPKENYFFGKTVSLFGQYAFIGAPLAYNETTRSNTGAVYVFNKVGTKWQFLKKIIEPTINGWADYGIAIDNNDEYCIVGAPQFGSSGAAYIYKRTGSNWERQLKLPEYYGSDFGYSVAIDSTNIVVGGPDNSGWGPSSSWRGAAWVYSKTGDSNNETWTEVAKIAAKDGYDNGHFGYAVDISGNYIIAGAWTASSHYVGRSACYIYGYENGSWIEKQRLFPKGADTTTNHFGKCVSIYKEVAAVGAPEEANENVANGAVYIFEKDNDKWVEKAKIISPDKSRYEDFGQSVDLHHNKIIIGARKAVYIYEKIQNAWNLVDSVHNNYFNNHMGYFSFGESVSLSDNAFLVGAYDDGDKGQVAGASHFYEFTSNPSTNIAVLNLLNPVQVYPNPVNTILQIDNIEEKSRIIIYNSIGMKLKELTLTHENEIDFAGYKSGIYFITINNNRNETKTFKVIKN